MDYKNNGIKKGYILIRIEQDMVDILDANGFGLDILKRAKETLEETLEDEISNINRPFYKNGLSLLKVKSEGVGMRRQLWFIKDEYCIKKEIKHRIDCLKNLKIDNLKSNNIEPLFYTDEYYTLKEK